MLSQSLISFLKADSTFEDFDNISKIISNPIFKEDMSNAFKENNALLFARELSEILDSIDIYKACAISNFIGFICGKTDDTSNGKYILLLLNNVLKLVEEFLKNLTVNDLDIDKLYITNKEQIQALFGCESLCISAMEFLSRDFQCRQILRSFDIKDTLEYLTSDAPDTKYLKSVYYINRIHNTCGKLPLLILDVENKQGFTAEANDLENCFHLIFLLENAIYKNLCDKYSMSSCAFDENLLALANGQYPNCWDKSYTTFFMECSYNELSPEKSEKLPNIIWGEMPPEYIPEIDGYHIILLYKSTFARSFDAGFLSVGHTALKPYFTIKREISKDEYIQWENIIKSKS